MVSPSAPLAAFATASDPRRRQGVRFPWPAILALAVAAILSNHLSVQAIAEWGTGQNLATLRALGFPTGVTPHQSTIHRLFRRLDPGQLSVALTEHFGTPSLAQGLPRGSQRVAIHGKAQRGRLAFDATGCPVHALSALLHEQGIVLAQEPIDSKGPRDKAEAELTVARALLERMDWAGLAPVFRLERTWREKMPSTTSRTGLWARTAASSVSAPHPCWQWSIGHSDAARRLDQPAPPERMPYDCQAFGSPQPPS